MIFDASHQFLFVHVQKTAGSSISGYLAQHLQSRWVSPAHLLLRQVDFTRRPFVFAVVRNPWERLVSWYEMMQRKGVHNSFSDYLLHSTSNPVSFSEFIRRTDIVEEQNLPEAVWSEVDGLLLDRQSGYQKSLSFNQVDYLIDRHGRFAADRVLAFENVEAQFTNLLRDIGWRGHITPLTRLNSRPPGRNWRLYYDTAGDREWVSQLYWKDIDQFGFRFND